MQFIFSLNLLKPFILFYVIGTVILFIIYKTTMHPQDGGLGTYALALIGFTILILLNGLYNIYLGASTQNTLYFVLAFIHIGLVVGGAKILGGW